jgi:hypothetical protein
MTKLSAKQLKRVLEQPGYSAVSQAVTKGTQVDTNADKLKQKFETLWQELDGPELQREYRFHRVRRWKADYRIGKVLIELEGGIYTGGRHTRGDGYKKDCIKYNTATALGYTVFRLATGMVTPEHVQPIIDYIRNRH